jgi:ABC-type multidrug transport system ATPase subunit
MLTEVGLFDCADTKVGRHLKRGITGGERKRAAIGVELAVKVVFLDELTSGLDGFL